MNTHTQKVLEYRSILDRLAQHCRSVPGRRRATSLQPYNNINSIENALDLLFEMIEIFNFDGGPPGLDFDDLALRLEEGRVVGEVFEPTELLEFAVFFGIICDCQKIRPQFKKLHEIIDQLVYPAEIHHEIEKCIDLTGEIKDSASPLLKSLRKELVTVKGKLNDKFEKYLSSDTSSYLSDKLFTLRDGRYVLPVRDSDKGRVKGIIHDRSSSGATFFIEPVETVELNNRHRELETAEREEINRILRHLSDLLYDNYESIKENVSLLAHLDFIAASARLSREIHANRPKFSEQGVLDIRNGRHPALLLNKAESGKDTVVPLNLILSPDENLLVITGPNTGGKTVALKTVGLLSLMAASGLFVPADPKSQFLLFERIFADIGDEQSIESSLSTYSSHLNHIRIALDESNDRSLVLLDELGAGTDPDEGSAMGQAVIEHLSAKRCYAIVTTHQGKLKALAGNVRGVINGSMEFDTQKLRPTFKFNAGVPGSSYAVEIARKLGLSKSITDRAWELLDQKERDLTRLITELNQKSVSLTEELKKAIAGRLSYESLTKIYQEKLDAWQKTEKEMKKKQLQESEEVIKSAKVELDLLIESAREKKQDKEGLRVIRRRVNERLEEARAEIEKADGKLTPIERAAQGLPGEKVFIKGIGATGDVIEPADSMGRVRVRIGNATMLTDLENLVSRSQGEQKIKPMSVKSNYDPNPGLEIDIRGMTFDEAEPVIQRFLDDASNAGLETVSIIHGKGTGMLRKKVQAYLRDNPRVESQRLGNWNEGSSGVTVISLKKD
jgi:DNA mismatch repair protein MutS2